MNETYAEIMSSVMDFLVGTDDRIAFQRRQACIRKAALGEEESSKRLWLDVHHHLASWLHGFTSEEVMKSRLSELCHFQIGHNCCVVWSVVDGSDLGTPGRDKP